MKELQNVLEVFYRQKGRYPQLSEIGYTQVGDAAAYVCGDKFLSEEIRSFATNIPCSPGDDANNPYVYSVYNDGQDYVMLVNLNDPTDPSIEASGCSGGCSYIVNQDDSEVLASTFYNFAVYSSLDYMRSEQFCPISESDYCDDGTCTPCVGVEEMCAGLRQRFCKSQWCNTTTCKP